MMHGVEDLVVNVVSLQTFQKIHDGSELICMPYRETLDLLQEESVWTLFINVLNGRDERKAAIMCIIPEPTWRFDKLGSCVTMIQN